VLDNKSVVVKVFLHRISARRHLRREWRGLNRLQKRQLSSPKPLFFGQTQNGRWAVVLEKIVDSATVLDVLTEVTDKTDELELLIRVCRELARQHSKGVMQKDLHLRNFLVAGERIYALDPSQMRFFTHEVPRKKSISQLAMLVRYLPSSDTTSANVICREYFAARGWHFGKSDEVLLQKQLTAHRKRSIRGGLKKCLRTNRRQLRIRGRRYVAEFDRGFCHETVMNDFIEHVDTLMDAGQILKNGQTSCVSRLTWNGEDVVVKRYNHRGFMHSLRHTLKRSRACRAWLHGHRLGMLEIPTPKPLAYIEQRKGLLVWNSYLVTAYIEGQKLDDFLQDDSVDKGRRLGVTQQIIQLLEKLWKYRITHGDLKHTNVLVTRSGPVLTDLDGMIVHRWRLLYRNKQAKDMERFLRVPDGSLITQNYTQMPISDKSPFPRKSADSFDEMKIDDWAIRIRKDFPKDSIRSLLSVGDSHGDSRCRFEKVPSSDYTSVFKYRVSFNGADLPVYVKRYLLRSRLDFAKQLSRASRARRAFEASLMLRENGFDAPACFGLFERRFGSSDMDNMLVTEEVENATSLSQLLRDVCRRSDAESLARKRSLIQAFARTMGQMHARGIFHGDLRLGNVLVVGEQQWRFYFIDNERTKKFHHLPARLRLKNLVQINMFFHGISNTDRLRFFKLYLEANPGVQNDVSGWARKITAKTNRRLKKKYSFEM
jgi:tRNA A-37 threonylcarbamoyl transferase component Bud32